MYLIILVDILLYITWMVRTPDYGRWRVFLSIVYELISAVLVFILFREDFVVVYSVVLCIIMIWRYILSYTFTHTVNKEDAMIRRR